MSLAFATAADVCTVPVLRAGVPAREVCRRGGAGAVAAVFDRSFYLRIGEDFLCIGEPAISNGPTTLIVAARVAELGLRTGEPASVSSRAIAIGDLLLDLDDCETWRAPEWPRPIPPARLRATCTALARRAASESPAGSFARAIFAADDTPLARLARPRVAAFAPWLSGAGSTAHSFRDQSVTERLAPSLPPRAERAAGRVASEASRVGGLSLFAQRTGAEYKRPPPLTPPRHSLRERGEGNLEARACVDAVAPLIGLGPGLTPSGDDFLIGALAALDALNQTKIHAALGRAVVAALADTSPLSASFLRAAAAGHVGENLYAMVAALIGGDADAAIATAKRIGHTSGWDALAGAVATVSGDPSRTTLDDGSLYRC